MKLTNAVIFRAWEPLNLLLGEKMPGHVSNRLLTLKRKLQGVVTDVEATRNKLIETYGEKDDKGRPSVGPAMAGWEAFVKEFGEVLALEVDLPDVTEKVHVPETVNISGQNIELLESFIELVPMK